MRLKWRSFFFMVPISYPLMSSMKKKKTTDLFKHPNKKWKKTTAAALERACRRCMYVQLYKPLPFFPSLSFSPLSLYRKGGIEWAANKKFISEFSSMHREMLSCFFFERVSKWVSKSKREREKQRTPLRLFFFELIPDRKFKELLFCLFLIFSTYTSLKKEEYTYKRCGNDGRAGEREKKYHRLWLMCMKVE